MSKKPPSKPLELTEREMEQLIALPSTSQMPTGIISRHQLPNDVYQQQPERPSTAAPYTHFANVVVAAAQSNYAKRQFSGHTRRSGSTIVTVRTRPEPRKTMKFSAQQPPRSPMRAQSFALEPSAASYNSFQPQPLTYSKSFRNLPRSQSASITDYHTSYNVLAFMHCGTFEAAANTRWLCENQIAYIVNLTGVQRLKVRCCPCPNPKYHCPTEYTPSIDYNTPDEEIINEFITINNFIAQARTQNIRVLIFNKDAQDLCQAVAIQYIMGYHKIPLSHGIAHLQKNDNVKVRISPKFMAALKRWEQKVLSAANDGGNKAIEAMIKAPFSIEVERRLAWL